MTVKLSEYNNKETQIPSLGVHSPNDVCLVRIRSGLKKFQAFELKNCGEGIATFTLKKRGQEYSEVDEVLSALRVGLTNRFRGALANRRVTPGTIVIVDGNLTVPQRVEDSQGDGVLWQTNGPEGPTYPMVVGSIDYNEGTLDFTFYNDVTLDVSGSYKQTDWTDFATPITTDIGPGGCFYHYEIYPDNADNYAAGVKDETEVGFFAKRKTAAEVATFLNLLITYFGDDSDITFPLSLGEFDDRHYENV